MKFGIRDAYFWGCLFSLDNGFTIEIYGFTHSLDTFLARAAHDAIARAMKVEDSEQLEDRSRRLY